MNSAMEIIFQRRLSINYISPAACEVILSGSGVGASIVLTPFSRIARVGGMTVLGGTSGPFSLTWETTPGGDPPVLCYNIYQLVDGELVLIGECVTLPDGGGGYPLPPGTPGGGDTYVVTPVTPEGEGPPSFPISTPITEVPPVDPCEETGEDTTCAYGPVGDQYRIIGYSSGLFDIGGCGLSWTNCVNCEIYPDTNCVDPVEWTGTFPVKVNDGLLIDQEFEPTEGNPPPPAHLMQGFCISATLTTSGAFNSTGCGWAISIVSVLNEVIWVGVKNKGEGPAGVYIRVEGCSPGPSCMVVESY